MSESRDGWIGGGVEFSRRHATRVVEIAAELRSVPDQQARHVLALRRTAEFLSGDLAGLNFVDRSVGTATLQVVPDRVPDPSGALRSVIHDHPLIEHYMTRADTAPHRLSDVPGGSDRALRRTKVYSALLRPAGMRQIGILSMSGHRSAAAP